jgi:hypothetical protein
LDIQNEQHRRVKSYGPRLAWFCERCECPTKGLAGVNCALFAYLYYMGVNNNLEKEKNRENHHSFVEVHTKKILENNSWMSE